MKLRLHFLLLAVLAFTAMTASRAFAEAPGTPQNLTASYQWSCVDNKLWMPVVSLKWYGNTEGGVPMGFNTYHASGEQSTYTGFSLVDTLGRYIWDSTAQDGEWRRVLGQMFEPGANSFYVESYNNDGISDPSNIAVVNLPDSLTFYLKGYPGYQGQPEDAGIYQPFMYQVGVEKWVPTEVRYSLSAYAGSTLPAGLTIDEETGVINWTPTEIGTFYFIINSRLEGINGIFSNVVGSIRVLKCNTGAAISGQVKDQNDNAINDGYVYAFPVSATGDTMWSRPIPAPIENGSYTLNLDEGVYYLYIADGDFDSEYYQDAATMQEATPVDAVCGITMTADVTVHRATRYIVSGRVADSEGNGINARIAFMGYDLNYPEGVRRQYPEYSYAYASESQDGAYSIALKEGYEYIAYAQLTDTLFSNGRVVMSVQFFDHVQDYTEAEVISLTGNRNDINFDFPQLQGYENSIEGQVKTGDNTGVAAYVTAYRVSSNSEDYFVVSTTTLPNGSYTLTDLLPGEYVLYAYPTGRNDVAPGYYSENGEAELTWTSATHLVIGAESAETGIDIILPEIDSTSGEGMVSGRVYGNKEGMTVGGKTDGSVLGESAITGAYVTLTDSKGAVTRYNMSGNNGSFTLSQLAAGTYTLIIDKVGFAPYTTTVVIDGSEPVTVNATLQPEATTGVEETLSNNTALVYPNPATNGATLAFFATPGTASVSVVGIAGMEVLSFRATTVQGLNTVYMNTQALSTGTYFVRITTATGVYNLPVRIVR